MDSEWRDRESLLNPTGRPSVANRARQGARLLRLVALAVIGFAVVAAFLNYGPSGSSSGFLDQPVRLRVGQALSNITFATAEAGVVYALSLLVDLYAERVERQFPPKSGGSPGG